MAIGTLDWTSAAERPDLLAEPVARAIGGLAGLGGLDGAGGLDGVGVGGVGGVTVAEIDPELADTAAFCERYGVSMGESANCVIVAARRAGRPATRRAWCSPPRGPTSTG